MTDPAVYAGDVPLRRVAVVVICDVPAVTSRDGAALAETTVRRALDVAPNRVRRGPAGVRRTPTLRHLVNDQLDDPRDVHVVSVVDLRAAVRNDLVTLLPLGEPTPLPTTTEEDV